MSFFSASDLQRQAMNLHHGESIAQISEKSRLLRVTNAFAVQKWEPETMANRDDEFNCGRYCLMHWCMIRLECANAGCLGVG